MRLGCVVCARGRVCARVRVCDECVGECVRVACGRAVNWLAEETDNIERRRSRRR